MENCSEGIHYINGHGHYTKILLIDIRIFFKLCIATSFNYKQWQIQDFPLGVRRPVGGGHQPLTRTLFGKKHM